MPKVAQTSVLAAVLACLAMMAGCGGDDGSPRPVLSLTLDVDSTSVELCSSLQITATVENGAPTEVDWYVNGVLGGSEGSGVVLQNNPATYLPPAAKPDPATLVIKAVSREDTTRADSCKVTVKFTDIYVSASTGSDDTGTGCPLKPFRSITHGLAAADSGSTVWVAAGLYDEDHGEVFSLGVPAGVALIGENWETTIIRCHGDDPDAGMAVGLSWAGCTLRNFTVDQGPSPASPLNAMVSMGGYSNGAVIDSIILPDRGYWTSLGIGGSTNTTVTNCRIVAAGEPDGRGIQISGDDTGTTIRNCTVSGFDTGIFTVGDSDVLIEGCTLENNIRGVWVCCSDFGSAPSPDLGGGPTRGGTGGNVIRNNIACGLTNTTGSQVYAKFNTWNGDLPVPGEDYCNESTGSIIVE